MSLTRLSEIQFNAAVGRVICEFDSDFRIWVMRVNRAVRIATGDNPRWYVSRITVSPYYVVAVYTASAFNGDRFQREVRVSSCIITTESDVDAAILYRNRPERITISDAHAAY